MLIDDIAGRRILVVGDVMLDRFVSGRVERISPEAPALVVAVSEEREMLGGAANVAANIAALGGVAVLAGVVGRDEAGRRLGELVAGQGGRIVDVLVSEAGRPTTCKTRYLGGDRHLLRADHERIGLDTAAEGRLIAAAVSGIKDCEAVVISDYARARPRRAWRAR